MIFNVNNNEVLTVQQDNPDGCVYVETQDRAYRIAPGDFIMLLNYYSYIKSNDIQCDFVNYNGKNKR